jgi:hypothetical protein
MNRSDPSPRLNLVNESSSGRLVVELEAFFEFSFWMSEQLERLVSMHRPRHLPPAKVRGPNPPAGSAPLPRESENESATAWERPEDC